MRSRATRQDADRPIFEITAMVDVVFMLLAFFVLASGFRQSQRDVSAGCGESNPEHVRAAAGDLPSDVPVFLKRSGGGVSIRVAGAVLRDDDYDAIRAKLAEINMPSIPVKIVAEADLSIDQVTRAMDAVLQSPMRDVTLAELTGSDM